MRPIALGILAYPRRKSEANLVYFLCFFMCFLCIFAKFFLFLLSAPISTICHRSKHWVYAFRAQGIRIYPRHKTKAILVLLLPFFYIFTYENIYNTLIQLCPKILAKNKDKTV